MGVIKKYLVIAVGSLLLPGALWAAPDISLRGFGTVGINHNLSDGAAVIRDIGQPDGPRSGTSFDTDTRFGVQVDATLAHNLTTSLQAVSRYNYEGKYTPIISRAFAKYVFLDNYQARLGRFGWDVYSMSDSRHVGYSYLWVRPPVEYFGKLQQDQVDGGDFSFSQQFDNGLVSGKLYAGVASGKMAIDRDSYVDTSGSTIYGGHLEYQHDAWQLRLSGARVRSETEIRGLAREQIFAAQQNGGGSESAPSLAALTQVDIDVEIVSSSLIYDDGPLLVQFMISQDMFSNAPIVDETLRGFVTFSYRFDDWRPYLTFGRSQTSPALPEVFSPSAGQLSEDQHSFSLGVRYDFLENMALKVQADHFNVRRDGRTSIMWRDPQDSWDGRINQLSATLDFVF